MYELLPARQRLFVQSPVLPKISDRRKFPTTDREQLEIVCLEESADFVGNLLLSEIRGETGPIFKLERERRGRGRIHKKKPQEIDIAHW